MAVACWRTACVAALALCLSARAVAEDDSRVVDITGTNFNLVFSGEWMLEFYAPWCPACKQFASVWESFAKWSAEEGGGRVSVGKVDVSSETMLSGQFMVTHLPTVFHIIEGEVRIYTESRSQSKLIEYIEARLWTGEEPISWWRSPTAKHMRVIGSIFWLSEKAKELQNVLEEDYQLPTYAVFIAIAVATIVVGLVLGGMTVCCIEGCMWVFAKKKVAPPTSAASPRQPKPQVEDEPKPKEDDPKPSPERKARKRTGKAKESRSQESSTKQ